MAAADVPGSGAGAHGHTRELLRVATAGSVDDGKSTLIGRLLYDTKAVPDDQLQATEEASRRRGSAEIDLALLTDGLRAEREQGITIDVAYRYLSTARRSFIIADTPGHVQYTRNMVTGASTADLALVLVAARHGVVEQTRRHAALASLLRVPHLVLCINKMDLVDYDRAVFDDIRETFGEFAARLRIGDLQFVPVSALTGDNVVSRSVMMPWYEGPSLLHHLEEVHIASDRDLISTRFPVQLTVRHGGDYRGSAGTVAGGVFRPGDEVLVLPSGHTTTLASIDTADGPVSEAFPPMAVTMRFTDQVDVSRGDLVCRPGNRPHVGDRVEAMLCWFDDEAPLDPAATYALKHTTRWTRATVEAVRYRLQVHDLRRDAAATALAFNDIGRVALRTTMPLVFDAYADNRTTGSLILVDELSGRTVAAGMIIGPVVDGDDSVGDGAAGPTGAAAGAARTGATNVTAEVGLVGPDERRARLGHGGATVWLTGLSGAGKSTIAARVEQALVAAGRPAYVLDGDNLRLGLNADLGFGDADRAENVRRVGEVARLMADAGVVVLVALISPFRAGRDAARAAHAAAGLAFHEVFVDVPLEVCEQRDPKGLYARARRGEVAAMTGIDSPYEAPLRPEVHLVSASLDEAVRAIVDLLG